MKIVWKLVYIIPPIVGGFCSLLIYGFFKDMSIFMGLFYYTIVSLVVQFIIYYFILYLCDPRQIRTEKVVENLVEVLLRTTVILGIFTGFVDKGAMSSDFILDAMLLLTCLVSYSFALKAYFSTRE